MDKKNKKEELNEKELNAYQRFQEQKRKKPLLRMSPVIIERILPSPMTLGRHKRNEDRKHPSSLL